MSAEVRSLSLPSLHNVSRQKGKISTRSNGSTSSCGLPAVPLTPSTVASSRTTPSSSFSAAALSSAGSWRSASPRSGRGTPLLSRSELGTPRLGSSRSSTSLRLSRPCSTPDARPARGDSTVLLYPARINRPDEDLSTSVRPDVVALDAIARPATCDSTVLQQPARISRPDEDLLTSVRTDVVFGKGDSVEYIYDLISSGEDVNQRSARGFTPLAVASAAGSESLVSLLLEKGADVKIASIDREEMPLHYAASLGHALVCQLLVKPTQEAGAIDAINAVGWTALHLAVASGHEAIVHMLIKAKASVQATNTIVGDLTALHIAALADHTEVAELLLEMDANANAVDSLLRAPLHLFASRANAAGVGLLLRHRADPFLRGGVGNNLPAELVPLETGGKDAERAHLLLSSYARDAPPPPRTDARFDLPGGHDILSAYSGSVPWGVQKRPDGAKGDVKSMSTVIEWQEEDENAIWL